MNRVYLLLGSNIGDRAKILANACTLLSARLLPSIVSVKECFNKEIKADDAEVVSDSMVLEVLMPMFVISNIEETEPWGFESDDKFLNMAVSCKTLYNPHEVLRICQDIERELGRNREAEGERYNERGERIYHSRLIDIDILFFEHYSYGKGYRVVNVNDPDLEIPHPKLPERPFAQRLLQDVIVKENKNHN